MKKTSRFGIALAASLVLASLGAAVAASGGPQVRQVDSLPAYDLSDRRDLAGFADDVWFGEVLERLPQQDLNTSGPGAVPVTRFRVRVTESLKGTLAGEVTVAQDGGTDPESGDLIQMDGAPPLKVGSTYLLATAYWSDGSAHSVVAEGFADLRVDDAEERRSLRASFGQAIANQRRPSGAR